WICFQGDGELHVTVQGGASKPELKFCNVSGDTDVHPISAQTTYIITPDKIQNGSEGNYYLDFDMTNIKLVSAEITNRSYASASLISATYLSDVKYTTQSDSISFSSGSTSGSNGYLTFSRQSGTSISNGVCNGTAKGRLTFPNKGTVTLKVTKGSGTEGSSSNIGGTVSQGFSMDGSTWYWHYFPQALNQEGTSVSNWSYGNTSRGFAMAYGNSRFVIVSPNGYSAYSTNGGVTWSRGSTVSPPSSSWNAMAWSGSYFVVLTGCNGYTTYSSNGSSWSTPTQALSGVYTSYLDDDLGWDGSRLFAGSDSASDMCVTDDPTGSSRWQSLGSFTHISDGDQLKWGGGYYANFFPQNTNFRYSTNVKFDSYSSYTLPLAPRALNYGPGYWLIMTNYGAIMKSSSACPSSWSTINGDSSSSYLYSLSSKSDWVGLCYGNYDGGRWVAYTHTGDVAVLAKAGISNTIQFSSVNTNTDKKTITSETTYTFSGDQITGGSSGSYYIEFDMTNINIVSASYSYTYPQSNSTVTEKVYDVINFASSLSGKNGVISASSWGGTTSNGVYVVNSASSARITSTKYGNLSLVVAPASQSANGSIQQKYGSSTSSQSISSKTTITVSAMNMPKSGSNYYMDFYVSGLVILSAKWEPAPEPIVIPTRSSVLDFSTSSLTHNSTLVEFGTDLSGSRSASWHGAYDYTNCWRTDSTTTQFLYDKMPYSKNDSYIYFFDNYSSSIVKGSGTNATPSATVSGLLNQWALTRVYFDAKENWPGAGIGRATSSSWRYLPLAGFTQPINAVMYAYGVGKNSSMAVTDNYVSPSNDFNRTVLKRLTTEACSQLKDIGARIYVIKYRHQTNWGALTRSSTTAYTTTSTAHSYTEIENCATNTGGTVYSASGESDLKSRLDEIAASIKTWAGYEAAKIEN
ncbi:MAG: hypothetical protein IJ730_06865, partial [Alphaproteobacteria bacterium]|nr:hypothetical protein [Alphaproteobacteria bacterium]